MVLSAARQKQTKYNKMSLLIYAAVFKSPRHINNYNHSPTNNILNFNYSQVTAQILLKTQHLFKVSVGNFLLTNLLACAHDCQIV